MANSMAEAGKLQHESGSKTFQIGRKCSKNNGDMSKGREPAEGLPLENMEQL